MRSILTLAVGFGLIAGAAFAQSPDAPLKGRDTDPALPPPNQTIPDKIRPSEGSADKGISGDTGTLSDRLEKSDGVIKPGDLPGRQPGTEAR